MTAMDQPEGEKEKRVLSAEQERAMFITFWRWLGVVGAVIVAAVTAVSVLVSRVVLDTAKSASEAKALERIEILVTRVNELNTQASNARGEITQSLRVMDQLRGRMDEALQNSQARLKETEENIRHIKQVSESSKTILSVPTDIAGALANNSDFVGLVRSRIDSAYAGAIVAFEKECPQGWLLFDQGGGRVLLGAGQHKNLDTTGKQIAIHQPLTAGGVDQARLTISNLPAHQHDTMIGVPTGQGIWGAGPAKNVVFGTQIASAASAYSSPVGTETPTPLPLPPFVAVHFCKKTQNG